MNQPEWNTNDKQTSLREWIDMLNGEARRQFLQDGTHLEIFFLFNDDGIMEVTPIVGMKKEDIVRELKKMLSERDGYAFIHIAEATAKAMDSAAEADSLLVHAESRDGLSIALLSTVATKGEEKLLLDAVEIDGTKLAGRFTHIFD
jgi:hypothetical protein